MQKIFFSYSRMDSPFALKLAKDLREAGADIWIDQLDIPAGSHWDAAVEKALNTAACVLVIISPFSTSSTNVMDEVSFALETGKKIVPVMLEECPPPFRLRRLQRIDFTKDYTSGLTQLLLSLNLVSSPSKKPKDLVPVDPNGTPDPDAGDVSMSAEEAEDQLLWDDACRVNTFESYEKYMIKSTAGIFRNEARLMIKQLELEEKEDELESLLWEKTQSENSLQRYQHYLDEYPDGDYKTMALAAIASLEKQDTLDIHPATKGSPRKAKKRHRMLMYAGMATGMVGIIIAGLLLISSGKEDENKAWLIASSKKDSISYAAYLLAFPNGRHFAEAKEQLDSINLEQQHLRDSVAVVAMPTIIKHDTVQAPPAVQPDTMATASITPAKPKSLPAARHMAKFSVGQRHQGGIIVYVDQTGTHGLIMAEQNLGGFDWDSARRRCDASKSDNHDDWRLPTKAELQKMYASRYKTGAFSRGMYWSSTEAGNDQYWAVNLFDGSIGKFARKMTWYVRPVRPF